MIKYNTIDMVFHIPSNHNLLPNGTGSLSSTQQPNTTYYQFPTLLNTVGSGHSIHTDNNKRYFALDGTRQAIRSTSTVYYKNGNNIQFECDFILRSTERNVLYCVGSSSGTNETTSVFEVCVYQNSIVVELGSKMFESNYTFEENKEYHILVTATKDGLLININGEKVSNFDKNISSTAFLSIPTGNYHHFIGNNNGSGSASNPPIGLDGYITNIFTSFNGMMIQREHKDYTNNDYNKILNFKLELDGSDSESKHVSKFDIVNVYDRPFSYVYDGVTFAVGQALSVNVIGVEYCVEFGVDVKNSHVDILIFNNGEYEIRLSGGFADPNPEPKVVVNENTTSALDFENGIVDQIGTTIWNKEGTADVTSTNKIFGENIFETKSLGDSLYTNSNVITGGSTPFTIEFYALIGKQHGWTGVGYTQAPLFSKNGSSASTNQQVHVNFAIGGKIQLERQANTGGVLTSTGNININYNEINKYTISYDGSAYRFFVNDKLDHSVGTLNAFNMNMNQPFKFFDSLVPSYSQYRTGIKGILDNINIHDGIATKVRDHDPYEEFLVVDLAFDGENNSTKIVDNARLNERNEIKYNDNVVALLHFDGNIDDEVSNVWSSNNSYSIDSSEILLNNTNLVLNGSSQIYNTSLPQLGNEYTIECFIKHPSSSSTSTRWEGIFSTKSNSGLYFNTYNELTLYISTDKGSAVISHDSVHHIALVAKNGNTNVFVDGILTLSSNSVLDATTSLYIGSGVNREYYTGRIDEFRITKGVARYTENFTPPTEPFKYIPKNNWTVNGNAIISTDQKFDGFSSLKNNRDGYIISNTQPISSSDISTISFEFYIESINNNNVYYDTYDGTYNNTFQLLNYGGKFSLWYSNITVQIATLENQSKNKITFIYDNRNVKVYVNGYLKLDTTLDIDLNFGNKFALFGQGVYPNPNYYSNGYFKNFKIYKGVAVIPEDPNGKIQLDFDNNLVDKYGNSTWTNNGVTFDQVNSVKGDAAKFNGGTTTTSTNTSNLDFNTGNFNIQFDVKVSDISSGFARYSFTNNVNYNYSGSIWLAASNYLGFDYVDKPLNSSALNVFNISNTYYNRIISRLGSSLYVFCNDVIIGSHNLTTQSFNFVNGGQGCLGKAPNFGIGESFYGYIDNFKSIKGHHGNVVIDRPAVHLPLETNAINTGFTPLTINSVGNPTYTTIDGKKCIKFESGKYLTINSNNIFNIGTISDFYIEFDFYILTSENKYEALLASYNSQWRGSPFIISVLNGDIINGETYDGHIYFRNAVDDINNIFISENSIIRNSWNNLKFYRTKNKLYMNLNGTLTESDFNVKINFINLVSLGDNGWGGTLSYLNGYMSNFKMFVGTSEIPETYNDKKVLDLDFSPTGKSYLFKDNNNKCVIHPVNITQRDYQDSQYCCTFNGTNQYLELGKNDLLNFGKDDFVMEFVFKPVGDATWNILLGNGSTSHDVNYCYVGVSENTNATNPSRVYLTIGSQNVRTSNVVSYTSKNRLVIVKRDSEYILILNDVVTTGIMNDAIASFNFNNSTRIGSTQVPNWVSHLFSGYIYSIKILRNTTDLTLLEDESSLVQTDLTYKLINTTDQTEQQITIDSSTSNIQIERDSSSVTLSVDDQTISLPTTTQPESNEIVLFGEYTDGIQNEITIYDKKPLTESTYIIPELDYTPLPYEVVDGEETITKFQVVDAGDHTIDGFTEGHPNAEYRIINKYSGMTLLHGRDSYYHYGINPLYIQNYVVELPELGITYPLEDHAMKRGYITYNMSPNDLCVGSDYVLRLIRRHDGRIVGEYEFVDYVCVVENLDCDVKYDAILFDRNDMFESITMSNRTPRPSE